jgi:hypothetical protein
LRSTRFLFQLVLLTGATAALPLPLGCSTQDPADAFGAASAGGDNAQAAAPSDEKDRRNLAEDSGTAKGGDFKWNPLCHVQATDWCLPDDDAVTVKLGLVACASPPPADGGASSSGSTTDTTKGCRVKRDPTSSTLAAKCDVATRSGGDGVTCQTGADCAPGFDCVEGLKGSVCRRYCCTGSCDEQLAQNGGATFCDVQKLVDANAKAPVCMPLKRCHLLTPYECAENETCAVVAEGETGCVAKGEAQVGKSCDEVHCAANLTCLGQPGSRKCYQLCKMGSTTCPPTQVCKTSTAFKDNSYGVCAAP